MEKVDIKSKKYKNFDLFVDEDKLTFDGDYAIVKAEARANNNIASCESFSDRVVINQRGKDVFNNVYPIIDGEIRNFLYYGNNDFIIKVMRKFKLKYEHLRMVKGQARIVNKNVKSLLTPTKLNNIWCGYSEDDKIFLYDLLAAKQITGEYTQINDFIEYEENGQKYVYAYVRDVISKSEGDVQAVLTFYIDQTGKIRTPIHYNLDGPNVFHSTNNSKFNYDKFVKNILIDFENKKSKQQEVQSKLLKLRSK